MNGYDKRAKNHSLDLYFLTKSSIFIGYYSIIFTYKTRLSPPPQVIHYRLFQGNSFVVLPVFGVRVSVTFHLTCGHIILVRLGCLGGGGGGVTFYISEYGDVRAL